MKEHKLRTVWRLSAPAIMAQLTSIIMQYIDAAMVGSLGAKASASIGVMSTSIWLMGGLCSALTAGFSVQVAHEIGAGEEERARAVVKNALVIASIFSIILALAGVVLSRSLPEWLGAEQAIRDNASVYFLIYMCSLPAMQLSGICGGMLQCSGNMKTPGFLNAMMCLLDVIFNALLIHRMGVAGAALGTALAEFIIGACMLWCVCRRSEALHFRKEERGFGLNQQILKRAFRIAAPVAFEHTALCSAMIVSTRIIAPLGSVAIAANSFAVTAESLCYMPGYGVSSAATTLVGQSLGAGDVPKAKSYAKMSLALGCFIMAGAAAVMYVMAPVVFRLLTPDQEVRQLGIKILRIEMFAEPLYAASIVASGALRGAGDTLVPSILNLVSIWGVRLTLSIILVGPMGLTGVWIAMCLELCVRGMLLLFRLGQGKWINCYKKDVP